MLTFEQIVKESMGEDENRPILLSRKQPSEILSFAKSKLKVFEGFEDVSDKIILRLLAFGQHDEYLIKDHTGIKSLDIVYDDGSIEGISLNWLFHERFKDALGTVYGEFVNIYVGEMSGDVDPNTYDSKQLASYTICRGCMQI